MDSNTRDDNDTTPAWQRSEDDRQIDADAYHIWTPRPLIRSVYWRPEMEPPREAVSGSYELFVDQRAFTSMHEHVWGAASDESPFGYLVGDLCEDPTANRRFVIVTHVVPSRFAFREEDSEQIGGEASVALKLEAERMRGVLVGWYHAHPAGDPSLTAADVATHERLFPDPWQVAILFVTDPLRPAGATFRRTPDGLDGELPLPFYEMVTNESLLAKGVRRSRVDWENVSTLDKVRAEPPSRPEPPSGASAEAPAPVPEEAGGSDPEFDSEIESEPSVEGGLEPEYATEGEPEPETPPDASPVPDRAEDSGDADESGPVPAAEDAEVSSPGSPSEDLDDDLDFDALIAEVENAGLDVEGPDLDTEIEADLPEDDAAAESEFKEVFEALSEVEDDLAAAEFAPSAGESPAVEKVPETDSELSGEGISEEPTAQTAAGPGTETPLEPPVDDLPAETASGAVAEETIEVPPEPLLEAPVEEALHAPGPPVAAEPSAAGRRRWALPVIGLLIAIAVIAVLVRGLGDGSDSSPVATPNRVESTPSVQDQEAAVPDSPTDGMVNDPAAGDPSTGGESGARAPDTVTGVVPANEGADDAAVSDPAAAVAEVADPTAGSTPDPVSIETLRDLSDAVVESISSFYGRSGAYDREEIECADLQASFVEVMDSWIDYSTRGRAGWEGRMPSDVAERDERLYLGVQDVERLFEASSCPRP